MASSIVSKSIRSVSLLLGLACSVAPSRAADVEDRSSRSTSTAKGEINFDDLQFPIEKDQPFEDDLLTDDVRKLDDRDVTLRGYILPTTLFKNHDIDEFVLVRDNQECCFGPGAALFDCVIVKLQGGVTTDFVTRPVTVTGKFEIDTKSYEYPGRDGPNGTTHFAIFRLLGTKVD